MATEMAAYMARCSARGVRMYVMMPPSQVADALKETRRHGTHAIDFDDEDGVCTFFLRDGDLLLRTAQGEVKGVMDIDTAFASSRDDNSSSSNKSPLARFVQYCLAGGASSEEAMQFVKALNNQALLDAVLVHKPADGTHCSFVVVSKMAREFKRTPGALQSLFAPYSKCAQRHALLAALIPSDDVDVLELVARMRRDVPLADTLNELKKPPPEGAGAVTVCIAVTDEGGGGPAEGVPRRAVTPESPRTRFLQYCATAAVPALIAAAFANSFAASDELERRLDTVLLSKRSEGTCFVVPMSTVDVFTVGELLNRLPERIKQATGFMPFLLDVDLVALTSRLRSGDPWRTLACLAATAGCVGGGIMVVASGVAASGVAGLAASRELKALPPDEAYRVCAGCARREGASQKLRMCSGCGLVLYCDAACQRSHWQRHKVACRKSAATATEQPQS